MKTNEAMEELDDIIPALPAEVRHVRNEKEVREVSELDAFVYEGESINHKGLYAWWRAYPKGIFVLRKDSKMVGAVGVWPIKEKTYHKITRGELDEVDITAKDICKRVAGQRHSYWYFADIVLRDEYRGKRKLWALFLLEKAMRQWLREGGLTGEVNLCALGFKPAGVSLLEKFKFELPGDVISPTGKPVYQRTMKTREIKRELDHVADLRSTGEKYDVFISYRRAPAKKLAQRIQRGLERANINVFVDTSDLRQGRYDLALRRTIRNTPYFVLLLSPGCFDRCSDKEDVFRQEIALAVKHDRKIIPIEMEGFKLPRKSSLPRNLQVLLKMQFLPSDKCGAIFFNRLRSFLNTEEAVSS